MAGLLDFFGGGDQGTGLLGNLMSGQPNNALLMAGLGLASGNGWGEGAAKALQGYSQGRAADQTQAGLQAAIPHILARPDIDPAVKAAIVRNPTLATQYLAALAKPPEYKPVETRGAVGNFNPQSGQTAFQYGVPDNVTLNTPGGGQRLLSVQPQVQPMGAGAQPNPTQPPAAPMLPQQPPPTDPTMEVAPRTVAAANQQPTLAPGVRELAGPPPPTNPFTPGPGATEAQAKDATYANRLFTAEQVLRNPEVTAAGQNPVQRGMAGIPLGVGNYLVNENYQKFDQAQRDFLNATLRRESGAVISPSEMENGQRQYFPMPGDSPAVLQQKLRNRQEAIIGVAGGAGQNYQPPAAFDQQGNLRPVPRPAGVPSTVPNAAMGKEQQRAPELPRTAAIPPEMRSLSPQEQMNKAPDGSVAVIAGRRMMKQSGRWMPMP